MSLADEYERQFEWRSWPRVFAALPGLRGASVLDLGCGPGRLAAELARRGARVVGIDADEQLLERARSRGIPDAEFRTADLRAFSHVGPSVDGVWCSFAAAYFPNLSDVLTRWRAALRPGGWIAITEVDDLFGHGPLAARSRTLLEDYARDALAAGRYDFHMGGKLRDHLDRAGFDVEQTLELEDRELAFDGPAESDVVAAWRRRFDRMVLLQRFCGAELERTRDDFLDCLTRAEHCATAKVLCCVARARS